MPTDDDDSARLTPEAIFANRDLTAPAKLILLAYFSRNFNHISVTELAHMTGQCRRTVQRHRQDLQRARLLPPSQRIAPTTPGVIYAIHDLRGETVKIGFTSKPPRERFITYLPVRHIRAQYRFSHSETGFTIEDERNAHAELEAYQLQASGAEWFHRCLEVDELLLSRFGIDLSTEGA
jgi:hypothetical protein